MKKLRIGIALMSSLTSFLLSFASELRAQADPFYKGKTIRIVVGSTAGGFYDRWGRLFARFMGKHIPGQPEILPQNMPGAGSVIATNHVYKVAKPDGLSLVMPLNGIYIDQLVGRAEAQFDLRKFHFIGSPAVESIVSYMRADAPYKSIADVIKAKEPPKCGSTGTASSDYILSRIPRGDCGRKV
jgi:tripartite-type tricarboxylate transporter receptor subunit TctC